MAEYIRMGGFIATFMTFAFVFSTMFTLAFYYYQGANASYGVDGMSSGQDHTTLDILGILSGVLDFISWLSPFALIKAFLSYTMQSTQDLYQLIDMLILRPVGWVVVMIEANYIISRIPTLGDE